ncbi:Por secretion system C-terminal sorting domain-containing protein [Cnuella takakiae]|uniref:Por secretion system C-terminal sorting domain-containing protein n=1 Tax=Cnuella takakiae TaxID=1302690 RepID=A0A1M4YF53_9BACT|nr:Ig-like domain-containing protein [Cnuella takakiae]SHF04370.1 Por secretion system C-terminal sorting domain-containing protein [Cnuella takakiae]
MKPLYQPTNRQTTFFSFSLILLLFSLISSTAKATTYYFSENGSDQNSFSEATNPATPWRSINKLNAVFSNLRPGDSVLFKRGDTFYGTINVDRSGTFSDPIVIGAYGTGEKPVIAGYTLIKNWKSVGRGNYAFEDGDLPNRVRMLTINSKPYEMGRFPNIDEEEKGYLKNDDATDKYLMDNELPNDINWKGAEMVVRTHRWVLDWVKIRAQSGNYLYFGGDLTYTPRPKFGYFIQNDVRTHDRFGEWAYDEDEKRVTVYFGNSDPDRYVVKANTLKNLVYLFNHDYITFDNLVFEGANETAVYVYSSDGTTIKNCEIKNTGVNGMYVVHASRLKINNCLVENTNNTGIILFDNIYNALVTENRITKSGVWQGMGQNGPNNGIGLRFRGENNLVEYNVIDSSGYCGIRFDGDNNTISRNLIQYFGFIKDDAGGIYSDNHTGNHYKGRKILNNIILDGIGAREGSNSMRVQQVSGVYLDNNTTGVDIIGNTVARCGKLGIYVHNALDVKVHDNLVFDNTTQVELNHDDVHMRKVRNVDMKNNIFFSKVPGQMVAHFFSKHKDIGEFGTINNNYYLRPLNDEDIIKVTTGIYTPSAVSNTMNLEKWKPLFDHDRDSKKSKRSFDSTSDPDQLFKLVYNTSKSTAKFSLPGTYEDAKGNKYVGRITLEPFEGAALIKIGDDTGTKELTVKLTSPTQGKRYEDQASVEVSAYALAEEGNIERVEFYVNGKLHNVEKNAPYKWTWDEVPDGTHKIYAKVFDDAGNEATSEEVSFTMDIKSVVQVNITSPKQGEEDTKVNYVLLSADASVTKGKVDRVEFYINGNLIDVEREAPYKYTWKQVPNGSYKLVAKAYNNKGDAAESDPVNFTVTHLNTAPQVHVTYPAQSSTFEAPASPRISASAIDEDGEVARVEFYLNGRLIDIEYAAPYGTRKFNLDPGTYRVQLKAYDNSGELTESEVITFYVKEEDRGRSAITQTNTGSFMLDESLNATGANEHSIADGKGATVYPNPANSELNFNVNAPQIKGKTQIRITNAAGSLVRLVNTNVQSSSIRLDVSGLTPGNYIITAQSGMYQVSSKFQKQ